MQGTGSTGGVNGVPSPRQEESSGPSGVNTGKAGWVTLVTGSEGLPTESVTGGGEMRLPVACDTSPATGQGLA